MDQGYGCDMAQSENPQTHTRMSAEWSAFLAMARKELIIMARYPVNFVASFGQTFLIVAVFSLGGSMFFRTSTATSAG
jgi:hypothetical protein